MKRILFITSTLDSGGISKSMINLLNTIDKNKYIIDLFIFRPTDLYLQFLPKQIRLITNEKMNLAFAPFPQCVLFLLKKGFFFIAIMRLIAAIVSRFNHGYSAWILSKIIPVLNEAYNCVVDYNGQHLLYYMIDKIRADVKISFFHFDYSKWSHYYTMDKKYYPRVNYIFGVSENCVKSLKIYFPVCKNKINVMENIISSQLIKEMAEEEITDFNLDAPVILTVGHVNKQKGTDLAIAAASILVENKVKFKWYFIGACPEIEKYSKMKKQYGVNEKIVFLGLKTNPYPYIKYSTVFCLPSQYEGKSIALDEAKILCKPIVVTNFSTVNDQFVNGINATICEMTPTSLATALSTLLLNKHLREKYTNNLLLNRIDNQLEINKLYYVIDR
ncbi:MAG: glycosyltransferase [Bacteroidales bacterium]|jgi:glycosyltransferase involved in cell wall biosynthesis|nr:glycosyltransferase [Bacteroidales bacterium]